MKSGSFRVAVAAMLAAVSSAGFDLSRVHAEERQSAEPIGLPVMITIDHASRGFVYQPLAGQATSGTIAPASYDPQTGVFGLSFQIDGPSGPEASSVTIEPVDIANGLGLVTVRDAQGTVQLEMQVDLAQRVAIPTGASASEIAPLNLAYIDASTTVSSGSPQHSSPELIDPSVIHSVTEFASPESRVPATTSAVLTPGAAEVVTAPVPHVVVVVLVVAIVWFVVDWAVGGGESYDCTNWFTSWWNGCT